MEFVKRLKNIHHSNGTPLVTIYGAWSRDQLNHHHNRHDNNTNNTNISNINMDMGGGPTVAFNVLRHDGSFVGYNEIAKLASLASPPIQFRTGCVCNPGACQEALGLSNAQILDNYKIGGHVCGDHKDILNGRPTGLLRVSFGKDSLWEDLDAMVLFLQQYFWKHSKQKQQQQDEEMEEDDALSDDDDDQDNHEQKQTLAEIYVFPIKSCAAFQVPKWKINHRTGRLACKSILIMFLSCRVILSYT